MTLSNNLSAEPEIVERPAIHYVFLERTGNIPANAPAAWHDLEKFAPLIAKSGQIRGACALYRMQPEIYRAGYVLAEPPASVPAGLRYEEVPGGKYARFVLRGSYSQLPEATGAAVKIVAEKQVPLRDGFNIENYANDPRSTPVDELVTEIMFPSV